MTDITSLASLILHECSHLVDAKSYVRYGELTLIVPRENLRTLCFALRDREAFKFEQLIDVCGVDYLDYGMDEWLTDDATASGFERATDRSKPHRVHGLSEVEGVSDDTSPQLTPPGRFAAIYHLLSITHNHRVRLKVFLKEDSPLVDSVIDIWKAADWFEREAFDLYGILFKGHPDLRRILTDYGFIGHPFRKDFPLIGEVEMRYDATMQRVIYQPVSIQPRILVPKVIRDDNRYTPPTSEQGASSD